MYAASLRGFSCLCLLPHQGEETVVVLSHIRLYYCVLLCVGPGSLNSGPHAYDAGISSQSYLHRAEASASPRGVGWSWDRVPCSLSAFKLFFVAKDDEVLNFLSLLPERGDYRCVLPCPVLYSLGH